MTSSDSNHFGLEQKAALIAENLYKHCVVPDGGIRLRETGAISPASCLKSKRARKAFKWVNGASVPFQQRFFTLAAVRRAIQKLLKYHGVMIPIIPRLPQELWVEQQARLLLHLCQRARKNVGSSLRFSAYRQKAMADWQPTIPLEARETGIIVNLKSNISNIYMSNNFLSALVS